MSRIAVVDFGTGNLRSVQKALEHVAPKATVQVTDDPGWIASAARVVFPGQGAIGSCVRTLESKGLRPVLIEALERKPFLGICLGLQALFEFSEEDGGTPCFGALAGRVRHFRGLQNGVTDNGIPYKIPHMGWNTVAQRHPHPLWRGIPDNSRFYFVHSFAPVSAADEQIYGETEYGCRFTAAAGRDHLFAVQFHPEKSSRYGLQLLENFVQWDGTV